MARPIPLLPAPRGNLPVPFAPPPPDAGAAALPAGRAKSGLQAVRPADPRRALRGRVSRSVCDRYHPARMEPERGVLCDFST